MRRLFLYLILVVGALAPTLIALEAMAGTLLRPRLKRTFAKETDVAEARTSWKRGGP